MAFCPCGSKTDLQGCCAPYINGEKQAPTAEALMRSRYTAYVNGNIDYIRETTHKDGLGDFDEAASRRWSKEAEWLGLSILTVDGGGETDGEGEVEFVARFSQGGKEQSHHERATFKREADRWFFRDGKVVGPVTFVRPDPKIGRNELCACGSGKKHKKCCGR